MDGPNTPPTQFTEPHFPDHQLVSPEDLVIDNSPITPTSAPVSEDTLAAERPLTSAFLLSLAREGPSSLIKVEEERTKDALPPKAISDSTIIRKEDFERYLDSTSTDIQVTWESDVEEDRTTGCGGMEWRLLPKTYRVRQQASYVVREYSDVLVVGVVLLFLATVICVEAVERFGSL